MFMRQLDNYAKKYDDNGQWQKIYLTKWHTVDYITNLETSDEDPSSHSSQNRLKSSNRKT